MATDVAGPGRSIGLFRGFSYPFVGIDFVFRKHPALARIWIWPVMVTALLLAGLLWGTWSWHSDLVNLVWETPENSVLAFLHGVTDFLVLLLGFAAAFFLTAILSPLVAAPFNGRLSEAVERLYIGGEASETHLQQEIVWILRSIGLELFKLLIYVTVITPLWVLSFFAPFLAPVTSVLGFALTVMHAAVDYTDSPQERRHRGVFDTYSFAVEHLRPMFGFGTGAVVFLFVPLLNLIFLPAVVAGGTLLYLDIVGLGDGTRTER